MPTPDSTPRLTELLPNAVLTRLGRMRINATRHFTNRSRGEHLVGKGGQSIEFSDFRDYTPGDDIRYVDWNIFSRLRRPYMKLYRQEQEMQVVLLVDGSNSMLFEEKFERAKQLAAVFGVLGLFNAEKVSAVSVQGDQTAPRSLPRMPPCTGRGNLPRLFRFLQDLEGGGSTPLEDGIERMLRDHAPGGRGVVVILSDFLTYRDLNGAFSRLHGAGLEIFGIQILGPTEIDPEMKGDLRLEDSEGAGLLDVSAGARVVELYQEYRERYERRLEGLCRQRGGRWLTVSAGTDIESLVIDPLIRKGWIR